MPRPRVSRRSEVHPGLGADRVRGRSPLLPRYGTVAPVTERGILGPQSLPKPGTKAGFKEADLNAVCEKPVELTQGFLPPWSIGGKCPNDDLGLSASSSAFPPFPEGHPAVLPGEDPPPYSPLTSPDSGSAPVITCRVCQSPINVEGKMHQHVVKCGVCNEATVSYNYLQNRPGSSFWF